MVKYINKRTQIAFEQVATGSYPTTDAAMGTARAIGHNVKHTVNDDQSKIERMPCTSNTRNQKGFYKGVLELKNTLEWEPIHFALFANVIGQCTTTGSDPYTHVIAEEPDPDIPPFNIEHAWQGTTPEARVYNGCCIDALSLIMDKNQPALKCSMDYHATYLHNPDALAVESLTEPTKQPYYWHEMRVLLDIANAGAYTAGAELTELQKAEFKVMNNLITEPRGGQTAGGGFNSRPQAQTRMYELALDWDKSNDDYYDLALSDTEIAYQIYVYRSANDYLKLTIENAQIMTVQDPMDAEGDIAVDTIMIKGGQLDTTSTNRQAIDSFNKEAEWMADS